MIIVSEFFNPFCEIVNQGVDYYKAMLELFPRDIRIREQIHHLNSIQDSIYKYDNTSKQGLIIRDLDIAYCVDLLKDASEFCDKDLSGVAKKLLKQIFNYN